MNLSISVELGNVSCLHSFFFFFPPFKLESNLNFKTREFEPLSLKIRKYLVQVFYFYVFPN